MSLIVGLGSPHGDDQLGWVAIDRLRPRLPAGITADKVTGGLELLQCLGGHDAAIVIDAAAPAGLPGTIRSFAWPSPELARCAPGSTHGLGLVQALQLAETLGRLPGRVSIYTVEAFDISPCAPLSRNVAARLDAVVEAVLCDLDYRERR
jgi:hydrogenase maturation protease